MIRLSKISTTAPDDAEKDDIKDKTKDLVERIGDLQNMLYAEGKHSILLILQGMDGSGKDGITRALFQGCSPAGVQVTSFKKPTEEEMGHDFLWRVHKQAPEKSYIKVYNRSQYEDILIQYVRGWIDDEKREKRMNSINNFEELLKYDNNTTILKFYLHISPEEQLEKLQERVDNPKKHWKHNDGDWEERKLWVEYQDAYEYVLNNSKIGWHIIPCDKEWYRDYFAAKILCETLESLNMKLPPLNSVLFNKE